MTTTETSRCPECSSELLTQNGQTFCAVCLLQQGMLSSVVGDPTFRNWLPPKIEELAPKFPLLKFQVLLGQGGMGAVYRVQQTELDRPAALKIIPDRAALDPGFAERFLREARLLASLSHPHIVTVYEFGQREGVYFLLMEFVDGVTLRQASLSDPIKRLAPKEALAVVTQLCDALQFAHDEGVVHRDIKPENILIDKRGRVKIADFGLAKLLGKAADLPTLTRTNQLMGTPAYMAPEQVEGQPVIDHRADIYSLGVVFYELLTGELPLGRFQPPSAKTDLDARLDEVVLRTLEKEPDRRYQQASQIRTDVDRITQTGASAGRSTDHQPWRVVRPLLGVLAGVALTLLVLAVANIKPDFGHSVPVATISQPAPSDDSRVMTDILHSGSDNDADVESSDEAGLGSSAMAGGGYPGMAGGGYPSGGDYGSDSMSMSEGGYAGSMGMSGYGYESGGDTEPIVSFTDNGIQIRPRFADMDDKLHNAVEIIVADIHQKYLQLESDHLLYKVLADGSVVTSIKPFPEEWRALENELWSSLDDLLNVEQQREFRRSFPLSATATSSISGGLASPNSDPLPGLLGWVQPAPNESLNTRPIGIQIGRKGRWFIWSVQERGNSYEFPSAPEIPPALRRFNKEPGPWMALANANVAFRTADWAEVANCFTKTCLIKWTLESHDVVAAKLETLGPDHHQRTSLKNLYERHFNAPDRGFGDFQKLVGNLARQYAEQLPSERAAIIKILDGSLSDTEYQRLYTGQLFIAKTLNCAGLPFDAVEITHVQPTSETAQALLRTKHNATVPVQLLRENNNWKFDHLPEQATVAGENEAPPDLDDTTQQPTGIILDGSI